MAPKAREPRIFEAESFATMKEWVYFCVEFDLAVCPGCSTRARRKSATTDGYQERWYCDACEPAIHPDLAEVLHGGAEAKTQCDLCGSVVEVKDCWISDDCRRLYCSTHLEPVQVEDRYRMARQYLQRWFGPRHRLRKDGVERLTASSSGGTRMTSDSSANKSPTRS